MTPTYRGTRLRIKLLHHKNGNMTTDNSNSTCNRFYGWIDGAAFAGEIRKTLALSLPYVTSRIAKAAEDNLDAV
eukprot:scaffold41091_cov21-Cyclotella_meneghiniana.AAC.4